MLDVVAHSRLGLLHRRAPVIGAENTLTHGGIGLRLLLPVLDGRLPANLEAYVRQLDPTADLIGQSTMVVATMRELAVSFAAAAAVRESGPVSLEVLGTTWTVRQRRWRWPIRCVPIPLGRTG